MRKESDMSSSFAGIWDYETKIIIVGFGGTGGCAAIEAHNAGAEVIILEKQPADTHYIKYEDVRRRIP